MFTASLVVGVVSVVPLCAMARGGPGGGAKASVRSEDQSQGTKLTLSEGVKSRVFKILEMVYLPLLNHGKSAIRHKTGHVFSKICLMSDHGDAKLLHYRVQ